MVIATQVVQNPAYRPSDTFFFTPSAFARSRAATASPPPARFAREGEAGLDCFMNRMRGKNFSTKTLPIT